MELKYIIIIIILFSFTIYYNQILSKKNILLEINKKKYKQLKKKLSKLNKVKKTKNKMDHDKDSFVLDNMDYNSMECDSLFTVEQNDSYDDGETFVLNDTDNI